MPEYLKLLKISAGDIKKTDSGWSVTLEIPGDLPWFSGHFPGQPVLPAVITTEISDALVKRTLGKDPQMVVNAKFKGPVLPGKRITISITCSGGDSANVFWQESVFSETSDQEHFLADLKFRMNQ